MMRSYSSAVSPRSRARSGVAFRSDPGNQTPALALPKTSVPDQAAEEGLEDEEAVGASHGALGGALRVRHEPQHIALLVDDTGDVLQGPVGVRRAGHLTFRGSVPEDDLVVLLQPGQRRRVAVILAL